MFIIQKQVYQGIKRILNVDYEEFKFSGAGLTTKQVPGCGFKVHS
jgi:hypothetical protein